MLAPMSRTVMPLESRSAKTRVTCGSHSSRSRRVTTTTSSGDAYNTNPGNCAISGFRTVPLMYWYSVESTYLAVTPASGRPAWLRCPAHSTRLGFRPRISRKQLKISRSHAVASNGTLSSSVKSVCEKSMYAPTDLRVSGWEVHSDGNTLISRSYSTVTGSSSGLAPAVMEPRTPS